MILLFKIPEPINNIINWIINLCSEYGGIIYFSIVFIASLWLYVWWNSLSKKEQEKKVYWPGVILIIFWPLLVICIPLMGIPMYIFMATGDLIVHQIKKRKK